MKIKCIVCLKDTEFEEGTPLEMREMTYIDCCGQLCRPCHKIVAEKTEIMDRHEAELAAKQYRLTPPDPSKPLAKACCPDCFQMSNTIGQLLDFPVFRCVPCKKFFKIEKAP